MYDVHTVNTLAYMHPHTHIDTGQVYFSLLAPSNLRVALSFVVVDMNYSVLRIFVN